MARILTAAAVTAAAVVLLTSHGFRAEACRWRCWRRRSAWVRSPRPIGTRPPPRRGWRMTRSGPASRANCTTSSRTSSAPSQLTNALRYARSASASVALGYHDSLPMGEGGLINDELPVENGEVPLPDWSLFDKEDLVDLDDDLRAAFRERAIPTPRTSAATVSGCPTSAATTCP
jgi:hypothetical protein